MMPSSRSSASSIQHGRLLKIIFSDNIKLARSLVVAILFTTICLRTIMLAPMKIVSDINHKATPINFDVRKQCSSFNSSVASMWNKLNDEILNATIPSDYASNTNFVTWISTLFKSEYQVHQIRPSVVHSPDSIAILRLLQIVHDRVNFLNKGESSSKSPPPPLNILVMGGSVTFGMGCGENHVGLKKIAWMNKNLECAWPARLENLFNQVLFQGKDVVKITNLATGGASTQVGKVVLEYRLFTDEMKKSLPHVVIWDHAPNDSQEGDKGAIEFVHMPEFVHAARNLRLCDNELPLVVMLDGFYGAEKYSAINDISDALLKVSSWYDLMGVSHSNVIKHKMYAHYGNTTVLNAMVGADHWSLHPPMGGHIGVAWTVFFNFLKAFSDSCDDGPALGYGAIGKDSSHTYLPTKYLRSYQRDETVQSLQSRWKQDAERIRGQCSKQSEASSTEVCTYAWMVNPMTGIRNHQNLWMMLKDVMVSHDGWNSEGNLVKNPRTGWYAKKANGKFSMRLVPTLETNYITMMTMKSYSDKFKGTELKLSFRIIRPDGTQSEKSYSISGYHETKTSIHIPHKFELPGGGAKKGDTLFVDAELVGGAYFKINGMAFCKF